MLQTRKKYTALATIIALCAALLSGCTAPAASGGQTSAQSVCPTPVATSTAESASVFVSNQPFRVGILQMMQHASLDEVNEGIQAQLTQRAQEMGVQMVIDYQNALGDMSTIDTIARQFVANGVDLIVAIATPAAQGAATVLEGTDIPLIFSAVSDPLAAGLVDAAGAPVGNVTGVSNAIDVEKIFTLAQELTPGKTHYGILYNTGEANSVSTVEKAKAYLTQKGIAFTESAITASSEVQTAAQNLVGQCDAIFVPNDNMVANAMPVLAEVAIAAQLPVYVAVDTLVKDGGLASVSLNYTQLGTQTADMVLRVLKGTAASDIPVEIMTGGAVVVNPETAKALGIDVSKYTK